MKKPHVILIAGPTGVGKTETSVILAKKLDTEIISCDSMQVYKGMDIGTAKVTFKEAQGVVHHMLSVVSPSESFSVSDYVKRASRVIDDLDRRGKSALVVGGTGLYADSLLKGIEFEESAASSEEYRREMTLLAQSRGNEYLHSLLAEKDPASAQKIHPNNVKRVIRALEYYHVSGERISDFNERTLGIEAPYCVDRIYFTRDRESLYTRIDKRVDKMIEEGLEDEVRRLMQEGLYESSTAMQALGYKEMAEYIGGKCSLMDAIESIKRGSRRYAKRQLTWFRRQKDAHWINLDECLNAEDTAQKCMEIINWGREKRRDER